MRTLGLKNYTTGISVDKTILEIEQILSKHGATDIWKQFDGATNITCINFAVNTEFGKMPFRLPMNVLAVSQILKNEKKSGKLGGLSNREATDLEQARRVGWRIIKDWVDAQMALVEIKLVKIEQVFLPYAYDFHTGKTLYETFREKKMAGLLMEGKNQ